MLRPATILLTCLIGCLADVHADNVSFDIGVEAVLSKAGCNAGTCHGNQNGKGGFKLSLRGQDSTFDHESLTASNGGRRINLLDPAKSLMLQKPTMDVAHQGGKRLTKGSDLYDQLYDWIASGAAKPTGDVTVQQLIASPAEAIRFCQPGASHAEIQLSIEAVLSDGSRQVVTDLAVYEPSNLNVIVSAGGAISMQAMGESTVVVRYLNQQVPVRVAFLQSRPDFVWTNRQPRNYVDEFVFEKLQRFRSNPAAACPDHVFLRRAYLDVLGTLPTAAEARAFVDDKRHDKRGALIDRLLASPGFADNWALKWADLLRVEEQVLDRKGVEVFHTWIRDGIASAKPMSQFVAELIAARGSTYENPPANYYRALRKTNERGEAAARVFLGTRLQCAQCHNHPFGRWTQDDYYAWSALFARVDYEIVKNERLDKLDKNQFVGEQVVLVKAEGEVTNPATGHVIAPRFLGADSSLGNDGERLEALAAWLTSADNRQFARSQVNRIWYHLMGKGLVDPVDDFRVTNPASHPALLEQLSDDFIANGFDIRHIIRLITRSESYQLGSLVEPASDEYAGVAARRLTAEQLLDCQSQALHASLRFNGHSDGRRAAQLPGVHKVRFREQAPSAADRFLFTFGKPQRLMTCECERSDSTTLSQALMLVNGECIDDLLTQESNLIDQLLRQGTVLDDAITALYWSALSRRPRDAERNQAHSIVARGGTQRKGLEDIAWALLNAKEFVFRQ